MPNETMRERFEERFVRCRLLRGGDKYPRLESFETSEELLSFIQSEIKQAVEKREGEIVEMITSLITEKYDTKPILRTAISDYELKTKATIVLDIIELIKNKSV